METVLKFAHVGLNNIVQTNRVIAIIPPKTITANRILETAKRQGLFIDCTRGRSHRAILILDDHSNDAAQALPSRSDRNAGRLPHRRRRGAS